MDVLYTIIQNTALNGMPKWYKAVTLSIFSLIVALVISSYYLLVFHGSDMIIRFGY